MKEVNYAMGLYPLNKRNDNKLYGCRFVEAIYDERISGQVLIFKHEYLHLNIDIVVRESEVLISDYYGDSMDRNDIYYVILSNSGRM